MRTPDGRIIAGNQHGSPSVIDTWLHGIDNKYIRTQYFYKGIYVGYTDYDYSTGDWGERTIDDIREVAKFSDSLAQHNYQYAGRYYCLQPQKENKFYSQLTQNGDIFPMSHTGSMKSHTFSFTIFIPHVSAHPYGGAKFLNPIILSVL